MTGHGNIRGLFYGARLKNGDFPTLKTLGCTKIKGVKYENHM